MAALMVGGAFAGCVGSGGPLAADFEARSQDNQSFTFDAGTSSGSPDTFQWDFGDGNTGEGKVVEHRYEYINGEYDVTLTISSGSQTQAVTKAVTTGTSPNQMPMLMVSVDKRWVKPDQEVLFDARATHDMDGDPVVLAWDFNYEIEPDQLESFVNIGMQQYESDDAEVDHSAHGGEDTGEPRSYEPPTKEELDEAWHRYRVMLEERPSLTDTKPRHGGAAGSPYEAEYNSGFDGKVNDTSPMQFFSWPEAGTYFVLVDAKDVKGDHTRGFVTIKVDSEAPEDNQSQSMDGAIDYAGPDVLFGGEDPGDGVPRNWWLGQFQFPYPGTFHVTAAITQETGAEVTLYVCRASADITWQDCAGGNRNKATAGPAVDQLAATVQLDEKDPGYNFAVYAVAESETPSGAQIRLNVTATKSFDLNPWYDTESGTGGGGHH
jgi:PKD repeat protein